MGSFDRFATEAVKAIEGETALIRSLADLIVSLTAQAQEVQAAHDALAAEVERLRADRDAWRVASLGSLGDALEIVVAEREELITRNSALAAELAALKAEVGPLLARYADVLRSDYETRHWQGSQAQLDESFARALVERWQTED